jgi:glycosyltransferase involved in cell wall biosynthesis
MRILYHHRILARDGMQVHVAEIVAALRRRGHTVTLLGPDGEAELPGSMPSTRTSPLARRIGALRSRMPAWFGEVLELAYNALAWRRLALAARKARPDVIYERYNLFLLAGVWLKRALNVPLILEVNAPLAQERATYGTLALHPLARWAERYVWRRADVVLPVSYALATHLQAAGVPTSRIHVIPNGAHISAAESAASRSARRQAIGVTDKVVVGFVGFVRPWHGLHRVLDAIAAAERRDLHLLIVGTGPAVADLTARAADLGLSDRLTVTGAVPHDEVRAYLGIFDVALQPEVTPYASPLKLVEYMAAGCAIVAPDRPNIRELVTPEVSALLVPADDDTALGTAIRDLAADPQRRAALGAAARQTIQERGQTWDGNAARIVALARGCRGAAPSAIPMPAE